MPTYVDLAIEDEDVALIRRATDGAGKVDWNSDDLSPVKLKIKNLHLSLQGESCCYCRKSFAGEFRMVIDIEHVLPKSEFPGFMFEPVNLSVACKRCNMLIKGECWRFVHGADKDAVCNNVTASAAYEIIHPNLDVYADHLMHVSIDINGFRFRKFLCRSASEKGAFTYKYFELERVEVDVLDEAQGLKPVESDAALARAIKALELLVGIDV